MEKRASVPILIPLDPAEFWKQIREIIRKEISRDQKEHVIPTNIMETSGLTE